MQAPPSLTAACTTFDRPNAKLGRGVAQLANQNGFENKHRQHGPNRVNHDAFPAQDGAGDTAGPDLTKGIQVSLLSSSGRS